MDPSSPPSSSAAAPSGRKAPAHKQGRAPCSAIRVGLSQGQTVRIRGGVHGSPLQAVNQFLFGHTRPQTDLTEDVT